MSETVHSRYKVEILSGDDVIITLGAPKSSSALSVVTMAQREMSRIPIASHAVIRGLNGKTVEIDAQDGWISAHIAAIKLRT